VVDVVTFTAAFQALEVGPWEVALALLEVAKRQVWRCVLGDLKRAGDWPFWEKNIITYKNYIEL
jgi:hypothetical protein